MRKFEDRLNHAVLGLFTALTVLLLAFLIYFIFRESFPAIRDVGLKNLLLGSQWRPLIYTDEPSFGMRNMILSTLFVAVLAVGFSLIIGAYDGFYGPGTGSFLIIAFTTLAKMDVTHANAQAKAINVTTNITSMAVFLIGGADET